MKSLTFLLLLSFISFEVSADPKTCQNIKKFVLKGNSQVLCGKYFHHFNPGSSRSYKKSGKSKLRIAGFNLLFPGSLQTYFKDNKLIADIINQFDIVVAVELLDVVGKAKKHNKKVLKALKKKSLKNTEKKKLEALYRAPGYVKILKQLQKQDRSWSLIISPTGESANAIAQKEYVGFFYRGSTVKPKDSFHCKKHYNIQSKPYACFPDLSEEFMGRNVRKVFAKRPFLGEFESGDFTFSLLGTHVIFGSPKDAKRKSEILGAAFGISNYRDIGRGVSEKNYARFAETKVLIELEGNLQKESKQKDILLIGDFNLESDLPQLDDYLDLFPGGKILIDRPTSLSYGRDDKKGRATKGLSNNYDHIILDPSETNECHNGQVYNFTKGNIAKELNKKYLVRSSSRGNNIMNDAGREKMEKRLKEFEKEIANLKTISRGKIVADPMRATLLANYKKRVFDEQLNNKKYYRYIIELLSDHLPVFISCDR